MAYWGVTIDDIKADYETAATTWTDAQLTSALAVGYDWTRKKLYRNWKERYADWDANDAPDAIQRLVLLSIYAELAKRLYYREQLSETYKGAYEDAVKIQKEQCRQIQTGELRLDSVSDDLATLSSIDIDPDNKYEVF